MGYAQSIFPRVSRMGYSSNTLSVRFRRGWSSIGWATRFVKRWCTRALKSRLEPIREFVGTLRNHLPYILPYVSTRLTNAKGEGINRLLRMVNNRASGFATLAAFIYLIMLEVGDVDIPESFPARFRMA